MDDVSAMQPNLRPNASLPPRLQSPLMGDYDSDDEPPIINMQTVMYGTIINDLIRRIERIQERNEVLEEYCNSAKNISENQGSAAEKEIVELNTLIAAESKRVDEFNKKCDEINSTRDDLMSQHLAKVKFVDERFEATRIKFYSEIKAINAKINVIEDFKLVAESMKAKYDKQNETILQKEQEMQQILNQIEFKAKIHKENLKKEAYKQILNTSEEFQLELKHTVPMTVQRVMRENIVLENELLRLWNDYADMGDNTLDHDYHMQDYKEKINEARLVVKRRMATFKIQDLLLKELKTVYTRVKKKLSKTYEPTREYVKEYMKLVEDVKNRSDFLKHDAYRRKLEVLLYRERIKLGMVVSLKRKTECAFKKQFDALCNIQKIVYAALSPSRVGRDEMIKNMGCETFAYYLLNIVENCEATKWISDDGQSMETIAEPSNVYAAGDLGFAPKHIDVDKGIRRQIEAMKSASAQSITTTIPELKSLQDKPAEEKSKATSVDKSISVSSEASSSLISSEEEYIQKEISEDMFEDERSEWEYEMQDAFADYMNFEE